MGIGKDTLEYFMRPGHTEDTVGYAGDSGLAWKGGEASIEKFGPRFGKVSTAPGSKHDPQAHLLV